MTCLTPSEFKTHRVASPIGIPWDLWYDVFGTGRGFDKNKAKVKIWTPPSPSTTRQSWTDDWVQRRAKRLGTSIWSGKKRIGREPLFASFTQKSVWSDRAEKLGTDRNVTQESGSECALRMLGKEMSRLTLQLLFGRGGGRGKKGTGGTTTLGQIWKRAVNTRGFYP